MAREQTVTDKEIVKAIKSSSTMREAARKVNLHPTSFISRAKKLNAYQPNPGRRGVPRPFDERSNTRIPLNEILEGKHPQYQTGKLKNRLINEKILEDKCSSCGDDNHLFSRILDHKNGINNDHRLSNLRLLCPNCNASLPTHAGRNKNKKVNMIVDEQIVDNVLAGKNNRNILLDLQLTPNGANYKRVDKVRWMVEYVRKQL